MIQDKTKSYYQQKVTDVLQYVNNNIGGDLSVKTLSAHFGISFFHFHRIMKAAINESLGAYIDRIRFETAIKLLRYSNEPLTDIASHIGYLDLSSFSKAFSKEFGLSPLEFRNNKAIVLNTHIDYRVSEEKKIITNLKPKIISIPDKKVCCINVVGKYGSEGTYKAWDELGDFVMKNKIVGWRPDVFAVYYDDPDIVGIESCATDLCIATKKIFKEEGRIKAKTIAGGKFVVFRYKGSYDYLWELYNSIYKDWVLFSDLKIRDLPSIEKYLNFEHNTKPNNLLTEIYIPIE
ncbi:MAG: AraC family transcriptional regulator [Bacteroidales bacterium]|nr:MAG: AraC family transcriptional regulator [Bacteroidales bacterium]